MLPSTKKRKTTSNEPGPGLIHRSHLNQLSSTTSSVCDEPTVLVSFQICLSNCPQIPCQLLNVKSEKLFLKPSTSISYLHGSPNIEPRTAPQSDTILEVNSRPTSSNSAVRIWKAHPVFILILIVEIINQFRLSMKRLRRHFSTIRFPMWISRSQGLFLRVRIFSTRIPVRYLVVRLVKRYFEKESAISIPI